MVQETLIIMPKLFSHTCVQCIMGRCELIAKPCKKLLYFIGHVASNFLYIANIVSKLPFGFNFYIQNIYRDYLNLSVKF